MERVDAFGLPDPELQVAFYPDRLVGLGITPADLSDTVSAYFRDIAAGDLETTDGQWLVRLAGTDADPGVLAALPILTSTGIVELGSLADLRRVTEEPTNLVLFDGKPGVGLAVTKNAEANIIDLVAEVNEYLEWRNTLKDKTGVEVILVDDQTVPMKLALSVMQTNALIGLSLVLLVTWLFLGTRIAILTSLGIPFTLGGTFLAVYLLGWTLNTNILIAVVIALGMLVDDAVVVVESMYYRMQRGADGLDAAIASLREVFAPVTSSILTTIAAFLPLALIPGILGDFLRVIPVTVCIALGISLIEAYWMLPAHVIVFQKVGRRGSRVEQARQDATHWIRINYTRWLLRALRHPIISVIIAAGLLIFAFATLAAGQIRFDFFAADQERMFYVNVTMPNGTSLQRTADMVATVEDAALQVIDPSELRASVVYAGQMFTETDQLFGDTVGQVFVSLAPATNGSLSPFEVADAVEEAVRGIPGPESLSLLRMSGGPPVEAPVNLKLRGDEFEDIVEAASHMRSYLESNEIYANVDSDYREGNPALVLKHDGDAIKRAGLSPQIVNRTLRMYVDGEIVTQYQAEGEEVTVRVLPARTADSNIDDLLRYTISLPNGLPVALGELLTATPTASQNNIRHYNFRRAISLTADIDTNLTNTVEANDLVTEEWLRVRDNYPNIDIDQTGELDDIYESIDAILLLFVFGLGLIYLILGTQFRSYFQPFMIIATVPLAMAGVLLGLLITGNPASLYTMYGVVALVGISVNSAIVLISAANQRLAAGMGLLHAIVYAARRRVIPILITSLTTIAGLLSLAIGIGGRSLVWGPMATAIVSGLTFSSLLTLFVVPLLYRTFMGGQDVRRRNIPAEPARA